MKVFWHLSSLGTSSLKIFLLSLVLESKQLLFPLSIYIVLLLNDFGVVLRLKEIPLARGLYKSLPFVVLALHLSRASLHQNINGDHNRFVSHQTHWEICKSRHNAMHTDCTKTPKRFMQNINNIFLLAKHSIICIGLNGSDGVHRVKILNSQLGIMLCLRVLA